MAFIEAYDAQSFILALNSDFRHIKHKEIANYLSNTPQVIMKIIQPTNRMLDQKKLSPANASDNQQFSLTIFKATKKHFPYDLGALSLLIVSPSMTP
ncbi:hypothetical protein D3C79_663390 [compost metagenome]